MTKQVVFFDGVCNLCNSSVQFIIKRDKHEKFLFASLQSDYAKENLPESLTESSILQSIVLKSEGEIFTKSTAVLKIAKSLSGIWAMLSVFLVLPNFIRNFAYDIIAKNRYKWFGKKDQCMIPTEELRDRFLD